MILQSLAMSDKAGCEVTAIAKWQSCSLTFPNFSLLTGLHEFQLPLQLYDILLAATVSDQQGGRNLEISMLSTCIQYCLDRIFETSVLSTCIQCCLEHGDRGLVITSCMLSWRFQMYTISPCRQIVTTEICLQMILLLATVGLTESAKEVSHRQQCQSGRSSAITNTNFGIKAYCT